MRQVYQTFQAIVKAQMTQLEVAVQVVVTAESLLARCMERSYITLVDNRKMSFRVFFNVWFIKRFYTP